MYEIYIEYKISGIPRVWLISPKVEKFNGEYPVHNYGFDASGHMELCVYDPYYDIWDENMFLSDIFVPCVVTWLYAYESWLATGTWIYDEMHPKRNRRKK